MYLPFDSMPGHSRVWIYQASRALNASDKEYLLDGLRNLCDQWAAHGNPLKTSFVIQFDRFVVLAVDEQTAGASGCSIDASVRYLKSLQEKLGLDFFDRSQVAFQQDDKIELYPLKELRALFENHTLSGETIAFNNLVSTKAEWENEWRAPVRQSWLSRHLPKTAVAG
jgi:hypothetical protein